MKLTPMEVLILNAMRYNEYTDALQWAGGTWTFTVIDNSGISGKKASGVISSLVQKGLVIAQNDGSEEDTIAFTESGIALFNDADGEECPWGGPRLLKEVETETIKPIESPKEVITVTDLAKMMGKTEKAIRQLLRSKGLSKKGNRWSFTNEEVKNLELGK